MRVIKPGGTMLGRTLIRVSLWDREFHETSLSVHPQRHSYLAWWGFVTFRTIHKRRVAYIMWRGRTYWLRGA